MYILLHMFSLFVPLQQSGARQKTDIRKNKKMKKISVTSNFWLPHTSTSYPPIYLREILQ